LLSGRLFRVSSLPKLEEFLFLERHGLAGHIFLVPGDFLVAGSGIHSILPVALAESSFS
jgi:hypothetical protein